MLATMLKIKSAVLIEAKEARLIWAAPPLDLISSCCLLQQMGSVPCPHPWLAPDATC